MRNIFSAGILILLLVTVFFVVLVPAKSHFTYHEDRTSSNADEMKPEGRRKEVGMELYPTGSSLPDCSHACGPCFPCKRVMVSFKCSSNVAEPCPVVYRCMCRGKYYHVPSN